MVRIGLWGSLRYFAQAPSIFIAWNNSQAQNGDIHAQSLAQYRYTYIYICLLSTSLSSLSFRAQLALIILIAGRRDDKSLQDGYLL